MYFWKPRGARLLVTGLLMAALVGAVVFPVSGATAGATGTMAVSSGTTVPQPLGTVTSTATTTTTTTTKVTSSATAKETVAKTTTATTKSTTSPATVKTSTPATTSPKTTAPTTAPTTKPAATSSMASASAVVTAPTIVPGSFTVPAGTGTFSISSVGNVPVGGDGVVQLIVDNGWTPLFGDTYIDISWDPSMVAYQSSVIKVLNTTATVSSDHSVRVMLGDFRRGYPQGRYPLAAITMRALREGTSMLTVSVDHVRYWNSDFTEFTDVTATASGRSGVFSTGALPVETQPIVTFTQNTLAPVYYSNDLDAASVTTAQTTATATTTAPTTVATVSTVATQPPTTEVTTVVPSPSVNQTPYSSYAPVSTRVQTSGFPAATVVVVSLAILGGVALLVHRRR